MDIDVMAKHMPGLLAFKKRVEEMIDGPDGGGETAGGREAAAAALGDLIDDLRKELAELGERLSAHEQAHYAAVELLTDITVMRSWFVQNREGLEVLLSIGDGMKTDASTITDPAHPATAPLTLDQVNATTKPTAPAVEVAPVTADASAADEPQTDPAPQGEADQTAG